MLSRLLLIFLLLGSSAQAECLKDYNRDKDYPHWGKSEDYADIRQEVIAKYIVNDLKVINGRVVGGQWIDIYTGQIYEITDITPDMEHIVSLEWAHHRGASCWSLDKRIAFANDTRHLIPVHPTSNRRKGSKVSRFMPPNFGECRFYLNTIKFIVNEYDLKPTSADVRRFKQMDKLCVKYEKGVLIKDSWWSWF